VHIRTLSVAAAISVALVGAAEARDQIRIVGSSTVFPYSQAAAEEFANQTGKPAPVVESTGTGGGMKIFCQGVGTGQPDATGASRAMKKSEFELCLKNGVASITEVLLGYDGLSMAVSRNGKSLDLTKAQLFQALAAEVEVDGKVVDNPYKTWSQIDPSLPNTPIQVFGPPPTSGTRDAWVELVMEEGCKAFPAIKALDKDRHKTVCQRMRTDGPFIEAGENDNLIVQRLESDPNAYGIFGYSFLYENQDKLKGITVDGVEPNLDTIADSSYPVSRPLFIYFKNAHRGVIPGLDDFIKEMTSEAAMGEGGYLSERGLVPLAKSRREDVRKNAQQGMMMDRYSS
jgi:phosphate transport system substrate-binding protein